MKVIQVGQTKYYVNGKDDMISVAHELAKRGYSISQIAQALGISERTVRKYMAECW
jgi:transposase-like protein